ncbi:MAG: hypothetical protein AB7G62_11575 [Magnetospirillum sp.]
MAIGSADSIQAFLSPFNLPNPPLDEVNAPLPPNRELSVSSGATLGAWTKADFNKSQMADGKVMGGVYQEFLWKWTN